MTTSTYIYAIRSPYIQPSFRLTENETSTIYSFNIDTNLNTVNLMMSKEQYVDFLINMGKLLTEEVDKHRFQEGLQIAEQS